MQAMEIPWPAPRSWNARKRPVNCKSAFKVSQDLRSLSDYPISPIMSWESLLWCCVSACRMSQGFQLVFKAHGHAPKLERQLRAEVEELLQLPADREGQDCEPAGPPVEVAEELKRRESRIAELGRAKAALERRAAERDVQRLAEREEKMKLAEWQQATGRKSGGKAPQEPELGPRAKDQVHLKDDESRIMPTPKGFQQCDNAQACVDEGMPVGRRPEFDTCDNAQACVDEGRLRDSGSRRIARATTRRRALMRARRLLRQEALRRRQRAGVR